MTKRKDMFSKKQRSRIMSKIKSRYSKLDLTMEKALRKNEISYVMYPNIYGNPDFLVGHDIVIFCDSSFWHGRRWRSLRRQLAKGSNSEYWVAHINKNRLRDKKVNAVLGREGYKVVRFWDDRILHNIEQCILRVRLALTKHQTQRS